MTDIVELIDQIIAEHKVILENTKILIQVVNDGLALQAMEKTKEVFMPGRLETKSGLEKLEQLRVKTEEGLFAHFDREETRLLQAFEERGDKEMLTAFQTLLAEHKVIRENLADFKDHVVELMTGHLSRHLWETKGYDMRALISSIHLQIQTHAKNEQKLLNKLRQELVESNYE